MAKAHRNSESCLDNPPPSNDRLKLRLAFDQGASTATLENEPLIGDPVPVRVGPSVFTVHLHHGLIKWWNGECVGTCDANRMRIYISDVQTPAERIATFFHELTHAIFSSATSPSAARTTTRRWHR